MVQLKKNMNEKKINRAVFLYLKTIFPNVKIQMSQPINFLTFIRNLFFPERYFPTIAIHQPKKGKSGFFIVLKPAPNAISKKSQNKVVNFAGIEYFKGKNYKTTISFGYTMAIAEINKYLNESD